MKLYKSRTATFSLHMMQAHNVDIPRALMHLAYTCEDCILQLIRLSQGKHLLGRHILGAL